MGPLCYLSLSCWQIKMREEKTKKRGGARARAKLYNQMHTHISYFTLIHQHLVNHPFMLLSLYCSRSRKQCRKEEDKKFWGVFLLTNIGQRDQSTCTENCMGGGRAVHTLAGHCIVIRETSQTSQLLLPRVSPVVPEQPGQENPAWLQAHRSAQQGGASPLSPTLFKCCGEREGLWERRGAGKTDKINGSQ